MSPLFVLFGPAHLTAIALTLLVPLALALLARHEHLGRHADRLARMGLTGFLMFGWVCWYGQMLWRHELRLDNGLPMNLCDWAEAALIVALLTRHQFAYELGYFWGLGGTLQGVLTPPLYYDFPDPQFIFFFIQHGGVVASLLYLTFGLRMRPTWQSLPRVIAASFCYLGAAALVDWALAVNYGFLRAKPLGQNLLTAMSAWPWYIPELVAAGIAFVLIYYLPFVVVDWIRPQRKNV
ncbi:MAG: TIGR02206 family membrane protein [Alphaproteobacteria bacterium]|nr:TIGR02206 family membrane protein [Alphaproteobacteria bacterium]